MKMKKIFDIINDIDINDLIIPVTSQQGIQIVTISEEFRRTVKRILEIESFKKHEKILKDAFFNDNFVTYKYDSKIQKASSILNQIALSSRMYAENFGELYPKSDEHTISIKLPTPSSFDDLSKVYKSLDTAISQVIFHDEIVGSKIEIKNFDNGSFWTDISLGCMVAVHVVGSVVWASGFINNQKIKLKLHEQEVERIQLSNDHLKIVKDAHKKLIKQYIEMEAKAIQDKHFTSNDSEHLERIKNSIKEFSTLIEKGTEVHPALEVAKEIKTEYPDFKKLSFIQSKIPQIENKAKDQTEDQEETPSFTFV
ncbi:MULTISPECIES: hypothetical protein [Psychrilyobacter]|uniref:Uncharacterized protein n=1 Tax=Psychrilyobacter piezotolerans TaxID=2293438 RepID=A0ABX9KIS7_9FUSO|nr:MULTISPECIES: hypothetical protein [Psychrilyobacter]MCS5420752.1 hypothetical protein [Psychrilyobacter sp. S5]NDI77454.1 hypothetical protein [Psychrilyobacter piezotolerans]RDE63756.1 hypothetical protein DV867_05105 [Psychrilyobacter sp. S5]REI42100.1 hypothetical protein DYH56_05105 [Psychrilyobacter piezotolerans]